MAKRVQHVRHNTAGADAFTGLEGELTFDITKKEGRYHDGATAGGIPIARADFNNVAAATLATKLANTAIANFLSTGIDDNASAERIDITNALISLLTDVSITGNLDLSGTMNSGTVPWARLSGVPSYQPLDAMLTAFAALTSANNKGLYFTGADAPATFDLTAYMRGLLNTADAAALRYAIRSGVQTPIASATATGGIGDLVELNIASASTVNTVASGSIGAGWFQFWKNISTTLSNVVTIAGNGANIDGQSSIELYAGDAVTLFFDGTQFRVLSKQLKQILIVQDQKAANTEAGTFTAGADRTRDLNTVVLNRIPGASLAANRITLPAGLYLINGKAPAHGVSRHKAKLRNVTDGADVIPGTAEYTSSTVSVTTWSHIEGTFSISAPKEFEIQHRCQTTLASFGLGIASSYATEVYTSVQIEKLN